MRSASIILLLLALTGCASLGARESVVTLPDGQIFKVRCQADGMVDYAQGEVKIRVDNRGRPGIFEQLIGTASLGFLRAREVIDNSK